MSSPQVLIVGSGPAGLVLALSLLKNGASVRIIEKHAEHHRSERGAGVTPRILEIEHVLGVDEVQQTGHPWPEVQIFDPEDPYRVVKKFQMMEKVDPTPAFPVTQGVMIGQWLHQQIIRKQIESLGCQVELGCTLSGIVQKDDGVLAQLVKTVNGKQVEESATFAYVIGADGGHSTVRRLQGIDFVGESREERVYLIDCRIEGIQAGKDFLRWGSPSTNIASLKSSVEPEVCQLLLAGHDVDYESLNSGTTEAIQSEFNKVTKRTDIKITHIIAHSEWRPNIRMANRFQNGRVFILGDAAHVHTPMGGQGLNSSIQDSFNLGWKLSLVLKGHASAALLESFETERIPVIAEMLNLTTDIFKKTVDHPQTQRAIQAAQAQAADILADKAKATFFRSRKLFQLDLNYRWSPFVFDERFEKEKEDGNEKQNAYGVPGQDVRAGDRAPDAPGLTLISSKEGERSISRLYDLFSPSSHTALIFSPSASDATTHSLLNSLAKLPVGLVQTALILPADASDSDLETAKVGFVFKDTEKHAYEGYSLNDVALPAMFVVRPDAMIGAFVQSSAGLDKYFSIVFDSA